MKDFFLITTLDNKMLYALKITKVNAENLENIKMCVFIKYLNLSE